jgi:hypothetical protein
MLSWLIRRRIDAFEREFDYDMGYARELLNASPRAALLFGRVSELSRYCEDIPKDAWFAAKLVGCLAEDCGPCTQLVTTMAERAGIPEAVIRNVLQENFEALPETARLGAEFARAVLERSNAANALRTTIVERYGPRALVSLGFALASARMYPTVKYALGHGHACEAVRVAGKVVPKLRPAH